MYNQQNKIRVSTSKGSQRDKQEVCKLKKKLFLKKNMSHFQCT